MKARRDRRIVVVSGPPGSGKTTLARPLAQALGFAFLSKDDIKEALYTALDGSPGDGEFSHRLSVAAIDLLWALAPQCPAVVLEANFRTRDQKERAKLAALPGAVVEVHCRLPMEEASRRFARRAQKERHHPAHPLMEMPAERMVEFAEPFAMTPVIEVDTLRRVDVEELARRVRAAWPRHVPGHLE